MGKGILKASYNPAGSGTTGTPPAQPSVVVLSEPGPRTLEQPQQRTKTTMAVVCTVGTTTADRAAIWLSQDAGTTWIDQGEFPFAPGAPTINFPAYVPTVAATWKAKVSLGNPDGYSDPSTATVSAGFSMTPIGLPGTGLISAVSINAITGTPWNDVTLLVDPDGGPDWGLPDGVSFTCAASTVTGAENGWYITATFRAVDGSGNPAPAEQGGLESAHIEEFEYVPGATYIIKNIKLYGFNPVGSAYVKGRLEFWSYRRPGTSTADRTKQILPSTLDHLDFTFGAPPDGAIDATRINDATLGDGVYRGPDGKPTTAVTNLSNMVVNPGFEYDFTAWDITSGAAVITNSAAAYTGAKFAALTAPAGGRVDVTEEARHACRPGDQFFCEAYVSHEAGCTGSGHLSVLWYDGAGVLVTPFSTEASPFAGGGSATPWTRGGSVMTVPAGVSFFAVQFTSISETLGKSWYVDNIYLTRQVPTGPGLSADGNGGLRVPLLGIDDTLLAAQSVIASKMAANAITAANNALAASSVVNANMVDVSISKVTYGTSIFAGDVILSRGISLPVIVLANTGLNLFGQADASTGATGLTSLPNVAIQSSGISLFSGSNTSVTVTSSAVTLWSVNGSTSNPYVTITSSSATFASGSNSVVVTGSGITISQASGGTFTANSTGFSISKSSNSVAVDASGITITQASGAALQMSSTGLALTKGSSNLTVTSTTVTLTNGSRTLTLNNAGALILSDGSFNCVLTSTSVVSNNISAAQSIAVTGSGGIDMSGGSGPLNYPGSLLTVTASVGPIAYPAACAGFITLKVGGTNFKLVLFNV